MTQFVDDIDGALLDSDDGETVVFAFDGIPYEIDLSRANAATLRDSIAPYIRAGRRASSPSSPSAQIRHRTRGGANETATMRAWATANGYDVADRGRIPDAVAAAYRESNL